MKVPKCKMNRNKKIMLMAAMTVAAVSQPIMPVVASSTVIVGEGENSSSSSSSGPIIIGGGNSGNNSSSETLATSSVRISMYNQTDGKAETKSTIRVIDRNTGSVVYFNRVSAGSYSYNPSGYYSELEPSSSGDITLTGLSGSYRIESASLQDGVTCETDSLSITVSNNETRTASLSYSRTFGAVSVSLTSEKDSHAIQGSAFTIRDAYGTVCYFTESGGNYRYDKNGNISELVTDNSGRISIDRMPPGNYQLQQVSVPKQYNGELIKKSFDVQERKSTNINVSNQELYGNFASSIKNAKDQPISGGVYRILDSDRDPIRVKLVRDGEYSFSRDTSDPVTVEVKNGSLKVTGIPQGDYILEESTAPNTYKPLEEKPFTVQSGQEASMTIQYEKAVGDLKIVMKDETTEDPVKGFAFELINKETEDAVHFVSRDGEVSFSETGETAFATEEDGTLTLHRVPAGTYYLKQAKAAPGYLLDATPAEIVIEMDKETAYETSTSKSNSAAVVTNKDGQPVQNVSFDIKDENGKIVLTGMTNENGKFLISGIPAGNYTLVVTKVPETYSLYKKTMPFKMDETGMSEGLESIMLEYTAIKVNAGIEGAKFELRDMNGKMVDSQISDANGVVTFEKIPYGDYTIHNTEVPEGYTLSDDVIKVSVDENFRNGEAISMNLADPTEDGSDEETGVEAGKKSKGVIVGIIALCVAIAGVIVFLIIRTLKDVKKIGEDIEDEDRTDDEDKSNDFMMIDELTGEPISKEKKEELEKQGFSFEVVEDEKKENEDPEITKIQKSLEEKADSEI